jgi:plasmid stabilization system protein ParE
VTYRVLPAALDDIAEIDLWSIEHFGASVADKTQAKLFATFGLLATPGHHRKARALLLAEPVLDRLRTSFASPDPSSLPRRT